VAAAVEKRCRTFEQAVMAFYRFEKELLDTPGSHFACPMFVREVTPKG
jgi:hypothetical protein